MLKLILLALGVSAYLFFGYAVFVAKDLVDFYCVHKELQPENWKNGISVKEHVKMVAEKMEKEKNWLDNGILVILFWPVYFLFLKENDLHDVAEVIRGLKK